ncbi:MAG: ABC transporter permease [Anaerolineae bacterium]
MKLRDFTIRLTLTLIPILLSILTTAGLIALIGGDPVRVYSTLWESAFQNQEAYAKVFNVWIPLTLASIGLVVTFRAGLWNIGVEGQIVMGAVFASWGALFIELPAPILIPINLLLASLGGMLWALLVGILKTRFGVHEIFGGVALNAIANNIAIFLIAGPWQPPEGGSAQSTPPFPEASLLPRFSAEFPVPTILLVITLMGLALVGFLLYFTRWGLELKAVGKNPRSALLLGVQTERVALSALALGGAFAGLAGAHRVLFFYASLRPLVSGGIGFLGLLIVLLVGFRLIWMPLIAFILAALLSGSTRLQALQRLYPELVGDSSLVGVLQGLLVLMILYFNGIRERWFSPAPTTEKEKRDE